ncbi:MAG: hypothetical protein CL808_01540 [Citromicrobium sp.]|mgnify:CR=1 FL=1|nr:hypothetical protein [Citromicrobium sp.]
MLRFRSLICLALALLALSTTSAALADSWAPPRTQVVLSQNETYRLTIEPSPIDSALQYFSEEVEAREAGEKVERPGPIALLERRANDGSWSQVWLTRLVNNVSPVSALVADDGSHIVTFDNWHSVGFGEHVIVIYNARGELIRSIQLSDFLPQAYIDALPTSTSSMRWSHDKRLTDGGEFLELDVYVPTVDRDAFYRGDAPTVTRRIRLADGTIVAPTGAEWKSALAQVAKVQRANEQAEAARLAYLRDPLKAPAGCENDGLYDYLREAFQRLVPDYLDRPVPAIKIIDPPSSDRHAKSLGWFDKAFEDAAESVWREHIVIAAPCNESLLVDRLARVRDRLPLGALENLLVFVSANRSASGDIEAALAGTGAKVTVMPLDASIPQRPERVPGSAAEAEAQTEMMRRQREEFAKMFSDEPGEER